MKHFQRREFINLVSTAFGTTLLGACTGNNFLNVTPTDQITDATFWKTEKDAELALAGLYGGNAGTGGTRGSDRSGWETFWNILMWDMITDNGFSQFAHDDYQVMGNGQLNPSNYGRQYFDYYRIRRYNSFLENIDKVEMDKDKKAIYKSEARFLRAYDYFRKVEFYEDVPLVTKVIDDPLKANLTRDPKEKVVDFILNELEEISKILPVQNMRQSEGHVTSGCALALKARLELYEGKYQAAMADAKKVMDMSVYELYPDYRGLFLIDNEDSNTESILEVQYVKDTYSNAVWQHVLTASVGGWSSISAVQSMVDAYEMKNGRTILDPLSGYDSDRPFEQRDPRLYMTILYPGHPFNGKYYDSLDTASPDFHLNPAGPRSGYCTLKYAKVVPSSSLRNGGSNVMVIRLAEVLLTYAEAAVESNMITDDLYEALDRIRHRVGMPSVDRTLYNTQDKLRELIRRERRVELAFEGLRYWDIKRWDIGEKVMDGPLFGSREGAVNPQNGEVTWSSEKIKLEERIFYPERRYLLPIPQSELDANPNIKQNPGY